MEQVAYQKILGLAKAELSAEEQRQLAKELTQGLASQEPRKRRSILELEGLGAHIWRSMDVDKYLEEERNSWD
jgi:hypothetical protein